MQGDRDSTNQRRVSVDQSEPSSQNATRGAERTSICERTRCGAQRKHVNITRSHGHECHFAEVQSGDIRRWQSTNRSRPPTCDNETCDAHIDASAYCGDGSSGARGSRFDQSVRRSSRFNQSEQSSRHATRGIV